MANKFVSRSFSAKEKVLLLVLIVVLMGALYYFGVIKYVADTQAANAAELEALETQQDIQRVLSQEYENMQQSLDEMGSLEDLPVVATYDNAKHEFKELSALLAQATGYTLDFDEPTLSGTTVRRVARITFTAGSYDQVFSIIDALENGSYRSQVNDIAMTGELLTDGSVKSVSTTLTVTFFETTNGAASTSGLKEATK